MPSVPDSFSDNIAISRSLFSAKDTFTLRLWSDADAEPFDVPAVACHHPSTTLHADGSIGAMLEWRSTSLFSARVVRAQLIQPGECGESVLIDHVLYPPEYLRDGTFSLTLPLTLHAPSVGEFV